MSQVTVTTATTNPPVTVVWLQSNTHHYDGYAGSHLCGLDTLGQHDVALPLQLILGDTFRGSFGITTMLQQQQPHS